MTCFLLAVSAIFLALVAAQGQDDDYVVPCADQQETCTCVESAEVCRFELEVEELQTFTSYRFGRDDRINTRETPGDTYFLDQSGFRSSINCEQYGPRRDGAPPECNGRNWMMSCWREGVNSLSDFRNINCSMPMTVDGNTYRLFIAVNGRIPGPTLVVTEEQIVVVNVINKLTSEGITIHWHGMHQQRSPWMDGVASISQIPIVPGAEFSYIFRASPAGTHWYHSHAGAQRTDGLFGGLIVQENSNTRMEIANRLPTGILLPNSSYEHTLSFLDWQRESSLNLFVQLHSTLGFYPNKNVGVIPTRNDNLYIRARSADGIEIGPQQYWSGLINGRGRHPGATYSKLSIFNVSQGITYRFRLIGAQSLFAYRFSIDRHILTVIASDGHFIQPANVNYVIVHTGERYDILVTANQNITNYWIRAETLETNSSDSAEAILHYNGAFEVEELTQYTNISESKWRCTENNKCSVINCPFENSVPTMNCTHLHQLRSLLVPSAGDPIPDNIDLSSLPPNQVKFFNFGFEGSSSTSAINGRNFRLPVTPYQTNKGAYEMDQMRGSRRSCAECTNSSNSDLCECTYLEGIGGNEFVKSNTPTIVFVLSAVGEGTNRDFSHPVHLHGHSFNILHIEHGSYYDNGTLMDNSDHIVCSDPINLCRSPSWNPGNTSRPMNFSQVRRSIRKDTVIVPAGGYVVIAFQADNPGYWFMHCHIESHQLEGMGVIIREYSEDQHRPAPQGINMVGDFRYTVKEFNSNGDGAQAQGMVIGLSVGIPLGIIIIITVIILLVVLYCKYKIKKTKTCKPCKGYEKKKTKTCKVHEGYQVIKGHYYK